MNWLNEIRQDVEALDPNKKNLRNLGLVFFVGCFVIGGLVAWGGGSAAAYWFGSGALLGLWALIWAKGLKPLYFVWMSLAAVMSWFMLRVILILIYFLVVTPIGLALRIFGKDLIDLKMDSRESYWHIRDDEPYNPVSSEKMY